MNMVDLFPTVRAMLPLPISSLQNTAVPTLMPTDALSIATIAATRTAPPATATLRPTATSLPSPTATLPPTAAATARPAAIGGGAAQIAFASTRSGIPEIYIFDLLTQKVEPIINMPEGACQPAWSPDGKQLAFVAPCLKPHDVADPVPSDTQIYIAGADGSEPTVLATGGSGDSEPAWSPDGKRIVFTSVRDGLPLIYVVNRGGGKATLITQPTGDFEAARQPSWSPAGNQIAFAKKRLGSYQVWTVTDAGQGEQQIVRSGQTLWDFLPLFSPDGTQVLFSERKAAGPVYPWEMFIDYELRGSSASSQVQLFPMPVQNAHFAPDGQWLVFEGMSANDNHDLFYATVDGQERTRLTTDPGVDFDPAWRP